MHRKTEEASEPRSELKLVACTTFTFQRDLYLGEVLSCGFCSTWLRAACLGAFFQAFRYRCAPWRASTLCSWVGVRQRPQAHLQFCSLLLLLSFVVMGFQPRALHLLGRCSTTWATYPALFVLDIFLIGSRIFCPGQLGAHVNSPIYISFVAGMTDQCHHAQLLVQMATH
jgi:hypothetical protein